MVQKEQYFSVSIYEKNLFGQDSKDSNVLILCPFLLPCWNLLKKRREKDSYKVLRNIATKLLVFWETSKLSLVFSGKPGLDRETTEITG